MHAVKIINWSVWEYIEYQTIPSRVDGLAERPMSNYKSNNIK